MSFLLEAARIGDGVDLVVTDRWTASARRAIEDGQADGLVLNYARGFSEESIGFVKGLPIRRLDVLARWLCDLEPIYSLAPLLTELSVQADPACSLELERLPRLRFLQAGWRQVRGSIRYATDLESLYTSELEDVNLAELGNLAQLTNLSIKTALNLICLEGISQLQWLTCLRIFSAPKLSEIDDVESVSATLQELDVLACPRISRIDAVATCTSLQFFGLSEGGDVESVAPLKGLDMLERVYMYDRTRVVDGDLSPIAALPRLHDLRMMNRRNYKPSVKEIQSLIAHRESR